MKKFVRTNMKIYKIFPNFAFTIRAECKEEAKSIAYDKLKNAHEITDGGFDFDIELDSREDDK